MTKIPSGIGKKSRFRRRRASGPRGRSGQIPGGSLSMSSVLPETAASMSRRCGTGLPIRIRPMWPLPPATISWRICSPIWQKTSPSPAPRTSYALCVVPRERREIAASAQKGPSRNDRNERLPVERTAGKNLSSRASESEAKDLSRSNRRTRVDSSIPPPAAAALRMTGNLHASLPTPHSAPRRRLFLIFRDILT